MPTDLTKPLCLRPRCIISLRGARRGRSPVRIVIGRVDAPGLRDRARTNQPKRSTGETDRTHDVLLLNTVCSRAARQAELRERTARTSRKAIRILIGGAVDSPLDGVSQTAAGMKAENRICGGARNATAVVATLATSGLMESDFNSPSWLHVPVDIPLYRIHARRCRTGFHQGPCHAALHRVSSPAAVWALANHRLQSGHLAHRRRRR